MRMQRKYEIRKICSDDAAWIRQIIKNHWGDEFTVVHGDIYYPHKLSGFVAIDSLDQKIGLVTYSIQKMECEVVTLNSVREKMGIGTALMSAVREIAIERKCKRVWLITTNDNLHAIGFYQKLGYELVAIHRGMIEQSRQIKPSIPLISSDGIPLRDEIELELPLSK